MCRRGHWLGCPKGCKVFASASTWYRLVRGHQWRRPRQRVHPNKPKVEIRACQANEIWHVDTTLLRLLDGSRAYLHAVVDNFSRRILAWKVAGTLIRVPPAEILLAASKGVVRGEPLLLADGGIENFNKAVDELVGSGSCARRAESGLPRGPAANAQRPIGSEPAASANG